jgi:hydroxymethylpyrimidine pyrophosphatase-like HAD family hydrolase
MKAYLFDVDGVLTNPQSTEVINPELITTIISFLTQGIPMGFVSGRGMLWLRTNFIKIIEKYFSEHPTFHKRLLDLLYVSAEFGVVTAVHIDGERQESVNRENALPNEIRDVLMTQAKEFEKYTYVETEKQTIFTLRYVTNDWQSFAEYKPDIIAKYNEVLKNNPEIEVQSDRLAINIRHKNANKKVATDNYLSWIKEKGFVPEQYIVFGDSPTDVEMGDELQRQKLPFTFVFVGRQAELGGKNFSFPISYTKGHCDEGTLEYLITHK